MPVYLLTRNYPGDKDRRSGANAVMIFLAEDKEETAVREIASRIDKRVQYRSDWMSPLASTCHKLDYEVAVIGQMSLIPESIPTEIPEETSDIEAIV